jgi:GntR family transcriptional regulator of vanillate catabolism
MSDQVNRVLLSLRDEIATGKLAPGTRLVEARLSARLGVSRTPVRPALRVLAAEGLLEPAGARGYRVKSVDAERIRTAILVRGLLEGFAAREAALNGIDGNLLETLTFCLEEGDRILADAKVSEEQALEYNKMNMLFHKTILSACQNDLIAALLDQCSNVPFAGTNYLAYDRANPRKEHLRFEISHGQHHVIVAAILERDTGRAEAVMREHANNALHYVGLFRDNTLLPTHIAIVPQGHVEPLPDTTAGGSRGDTHRL